MTTGIQQRMHRKFRRSRSATRPMNTKNLLSILKNDSFDKSPFLLDIILSIPNHSRKSKSQMFSGTVEMGKSCVRHRKTK